MKILYLVTKSEAGGAQTHVYQLSRYFYNQGHQVAVMASPGGFLEEEIKKLGAVFLPNKFFSNSFNPLNLWRSFKTIKKAVKKFNPDLVHCHSSMAGFLGRWAIKNKTKTIFTAHGWGFNDYDPFLQKYLAIAGEKIASRYCEKIICVSQYVKKLALEYGIADINKLAVIYNGVELSEVLKKNDKAGKLKIIFVGRLAEPKDPMLLAKSYLALPDSLRATADLFFIGDGPKKNELLNFVENNHLTGINILGNLKREEIFKILKNADIFAMPSKWEGFGLTAIEAMSCGLPVVVSKVGGLREIVAEDCGLLAENKPEVWAKNLEILLEDKNLREKMGQAARKRVEENFSLEKMLQQTKNLYETII